MNLVADGRQLSTTPGADVDGNGISDVEDILRSIRVGAFGTGTSTNPEAALRQVERTFESLETADGDGNVVVLTDGEQNLGGSIIEEVERLLDKDVNLKAFGVGSDASLDIIETIDPDGVKFTSTDELLDTFNDLSGGSNSFLEPGLAGVTIYVDENNNGILDAGEPTQVTAADDPNTPDVDETGQYAFTDLAPGTHIIREIVPAGFRQTFPNNNGVGGDNLIVNGSFEEGPDPADFHITYFQGSTAMPGWVVSQGNVDLTGTLYKASEGSVSLDLDGRPNVAGGVEQTFNTTIGEQYLLTFDLAGNPENGPAVKTVKVDVAGETATLDYDITGQTSETLEYLSQSLTFTATEAQTTLAFTSLTGSGWGPNIDNVSVVNVESDGGFHTVEIGQDGDVVEDINFGNTQTKSGVIQGTKWNDLNGDGIRNSENLVFNGDFSLGDTGFSSERDKLFQLDVGTDPLDFNNLATSYGDHTTGDGQMLIINGSVTEPSIVWEQTVDVNPNTSYDFGLWLSTWFNTEPAQLELLINGELIEEFPAPGFTSVWEEFNTQWTAGNDVDEATVTIRNLQLAFSGNDFALDDISFSAIEPGLAGVSIYLDLNNNGALDANEPVQITAEDDPSTLNIDETGQYAFENLAPGTYTVREVVPDGFKQTFPNNGVVGNNLVLNGGFEDGPNPGNSFINVASGATTIPNWAVTNGQVDLVGAPFYQPADGSVSLDLNGFIAGEVQQTIDTTVGERYLLTFDLAGNPRGTPAVKMGEVEVAGITADLSYDISGQSAGSLDYVPTSLEFTATDTQTVLKFKSLIPGNAGLSIDNVSVVELAPNAGFHTVEIAEDDNIVDNMNFGNITTGNNAPVITTDPVTELNLEAQSGQTETIDLSNWEVVHYPLANSGRPPIWVPESNNTSVTQSANANASIFLSDFNLSNDQISGTWKVDTVRDDDFMGFVFGYQDSEHFYLFDWKQLDQLGFNGLAEQGMSIKVVNANSPLTDADLGPTVGNGDRVEVLYRNTTPWEDLTEYQFTLDFIPGEFTITVQEEDSGVILLSETIQDDTYTSGKFGFYNYSQGQVQYEGFTRQSISNGTYTYDVNATDADQDVLTYSLTQAPAGMEIAPESGLITWTPENISIGIQVPVTVSVDDGLGGNDQQSFAIEVVDGNNPPSQPDASSLPTLMGTDDRDTLTGTLDNDIIIGKVESDRLTGNAGADQFVFQSIDDRIDRINDFEVGSDKIVLSDLFDSLGVSIDSYDQAIDQGYLEITSFGQDDSRVRIGRDGLNGNRGAATLAFVYDVKPTELNAADNFVI